MLLRIDRTPWELFHRKYSTAIGLTLRILLLAPLARAQAVFLRARAPSG